jgi:hypothetical protein
MESWMPFFVVVAALALVVQALVLVGLFIGVRRANARYSQIAEELRARIIPALSDIQLLVEEARPHITGILANASEVTHLARTQAQRVDRVMSEALERLRMQLAHVDQILTGALETVEDAGSKFRQTVWQPMQSVAAVVRGIQTGLEFYRGTRSQRRRNERYEPPAGDREQADENLFI